MLILGGVYLKLTLKNLACPKNDGAILEASGLKHFYVHAASDIQEAILGCPGKLENGE